MKKFKRAITFYTNNFLNDLPNGINTNVDYQGTRLSGGQRQRVAYKSLSR